MNKNIPENKLIYILEVDYEFDYYSLKIYKGNIDKYFLESDNETIKEKLLKPIKISYDTYISSDKEILIQKAKGIKDLWIKEIEDKLQETKDLEIEFED